MLPAPHILALLEGVDLEALADYVRTAYSGPKWAEGGCANLALGVSKYLANHDVPHVLEMDRRPGIDGSMCGNHVRVRARSTVIDSVAGAELAARLLTVEGARFMAVGPEEIRAEEIRISPTIVNRVAKDLASRLSIGDE